MVADADVPAAVLTQVAATLVTARFWDSWLAVRASRPASPRPGKTDWTCQALWVVELGPGGQQRLARYHEDIVVIPGVGGAVDVDRTLSLLTEPAWSTSAVSLMTTEGVRTQEVATVLAEVPARAPGQVGGGEGPGRGQVRGLRHGRIRVEPEGKRRHRGHSAHSQGRVNWPSTWPVASSSTVPSRESRATSPRFLSSTTLVTRAAIPASSSAAL